MRAGNLRDRVTFQRLVQHDDGYGNTVNAWADHLTVWADMRETVGREAVRAGAVEAARTATLRIRASSQSRGLTEADRLVARGRNWNVRSIAAVGNDRDALDVLAELTAT